MLTNQKVASPFFNAAWTSAMMLKAFVVIPCTHAATTGPYLEDVQEIPRIQNQYGPSCLFAL